MTTLTQTLAATDLPGTGLLTGFGRFVRAFGSAQAAARDYARLSGRSDAALARDGLTRETLARAVFETHFA